MRESVATKNMFFRDKVEIFNAKQGKTCVVTAVYLKRVKSENKLLI
jgi:hypothetical protein